MAEDYAKAVVKTISLTVQAAKLTKEVLAEILAKYAEGKAKKSGRTTLAELENSAGGKKLESIEITENNIRDFKNTAAKYDISYALKRDSSTSPPTYHVFFQSSKAENFKKAFTEYASKMQKELGAAKEPDVREKIREKAKEIKDKPREPVEKQRERTKEEIL